jgi:hypothetical protein
MDEWELLAHCVTFGELEMGRDFDWTKMRFIEK